ncbi:hypothetical protein A2576_04105 [Candidatus Amesbacteria bacterium RIFOXYD1_FULL_47_9]|uniref:Tetratricopeptide TPR_2 repeat protein n=1 Tax=Candidatus Amesbacteria bacterium RIFOXYD1_FULL_47_9 TaxID=1797267 RepID=A0A1F5A288_9BACT|nr:MAG: hypothetical protein A2576_04105 [Candidatus Amesbacteria bacterium RIFOXYD1_FULL_47_9]
MSPLKFLTFTNNLPLRILLTHHTHPLVQEILSQLSSSLNFTSVFLHQNEIPDTPEPVSLIIHIAGFSSPSLAETLSYTSELYSLLKYASRHISRFVLVLPSSPSPLKQTALVLVSQFAKSYPLRYKLVEVDANQDLSQNAELVIRQFKYGYVYHPRPVPPVISNIKTPPPPRQRLLIRFPRIFPISRLSLIIAVVLLSPLVLFCLQLLLTRYYFSCGVRQLFSGSFEKSVSCSARAASASRLIRSQTKLFPGSSFILQKFGLPFPEVSDTLTHFSDTVSLLHKTSDKFSDLYYNFTGSASPKKWVEPPELSALLSALSESLSYLQSDLKSLYLASPRLSSQTALFARNTQSARQTASKLQLLIPYLPLLSSQTGTTTYVFLLQDNNQPRPLGGIMDSLLVVSAQNGQLSHIQALPVNLADSQFRGRAEAPSDFIRAAGRSTWLLRDADWDPNFPQSAKQIAWFIEKELSLKPDIIVALNLNTLRSLLEVTGPLEIPDLNRTLTPDNFLNTFSPSNPSLDPPSSVSFLTKFAMGLEKRLRTLQPDQVTRLFLVLARQLENREVYITPVTFSLPQLDQVGWSGAVLLPECRSSLPCFSGFIYPVVTSLAPAVVSAPSLVNHSLTTQLTSTQITNAYKIIFTGSTPFYLRLYLPDPAVLDSVIVNGRTLKQSEYYLQNQAPLQLFGVLLDPSSRQESEVEIKFHQSANLTGRFHFQLDIPHQPGYSLPSLTMAISYPSEWFATSYQSPQVASAGSLGYNTPQSSPISLDIDFSLPPSL